MGNALIEPMLFVGGPHDGEREVIRKTRGGAYPDMIPTIGRVDGRQVHQYYIRVAIDAHGNYHYCYQHSEDKRDILVALMEGYRGTANGK